MHETVTKELNLSCYNISISADVYTCVAMATLVMFISCSPKQLYQSAACVMDSGISLMIL